MTPRVSIIVPVYNEGDLVIPLLERILESVTMPCEVLAVDMDPDAVASAAANVTRNGLEPRVRCVVAAADAVDAPAAPLVLANLLAAAHRALAATYARLLTPGGLLVLGGILDGEAHQVEAAVSEHGFRVRDTRSVEGWTSLACEHAPLRHRA